MSPETAIPVKAPAGADRTDRSRARARAARRHKLLVHGARVLLLVALIGLWEGLARAAVIDPFNFSMPSRIWNQISQWALNGTPQGSLWEQIWYTLYEALLGWVIGVVGGVVLGIALGRIRFLADVLGPYIKVLNALPRIVLAPSSSSGSASDPPPRSPPPSSSSSSRSSSTPSRAHGRSTGTWSPTPGSSARATAR